MINQKGGVFVRLSNYQIEKLYEVRKARSNDACGANAFNIDKQKKDPWKGGGFSIEELMKPRTKVIPGKFALKKR